MTGLLTDLYELTMAAGYFEAGKSRTSKAPSSSRSAACRSIATTCYWRVCSRRSSICFVCDSPEPRSTICARLPQFAACESAPSSSNCGIPLYRRRVGRAGGHGPVRRRADSHGAARR